MHANGKKHGMYGCTCRYRYCTLQPRNRGLAQPERARLLRQQVERAVRPAQHGAELLPARRKHIIVTKSVMVGLDNGAWARLDPSDHLEIRIEHLLLASVVTGSHLYALPSDPHIGVLSHQVLVRVYALIPMLLRVSRLYRCL